MAALGLWAGGGLACKGGALTIWRVVARSGQGLVRRLAAGDGWPGSAGLEADVIGTAPGIGCKPDG